MNADMQCYTCCTALCSAPRCARYGSFASCMRMSRPPDHMTQLPAPRELTQYSLCERGIRVVTGRNEDGHPTCTSNGAGKSAFCTAALWCLTGQATPCAQVWPHHSLAVQ